MVSDYQKNQAIRDAGLDPNGMTDGEREECYQRIAKAGYGPSEVQITASLYETGTDEALETFEGDEDTFNDWLADCRRSASSEGWTGRVWAYNKETKKQVGGPDGIHIS